MVIRLIASLIELKQEKKVTENALLDSLNEVYIKGQLNTAKRIRKAPGDIENIAFDGWSKTVEEMLKIDVGVGFQHNQALLKKFKAGTKESKIELTGGKQWSFERFKEIATKLAQPEISLPGD